MSSPARLALVATGGTIACTLDADGRAVRTLAADDLLAATIVPAGVEVTTTNFGLMPSWDLTPPAMLELARRVEKLAADFDGVVVTHGTDTLEETATLLSLAIRTPVPVVVTGAMRASGEPDADGPANIATALAVAADPASHGRGTLVAFGDEVHLATRVSKRHSSALLPFGSPATGPVGVVHDGTVTFLAPPVPPTTYDVTHAHADVPLVVACAGAPVRLARAALDGADGLVVAGMGLGHLPSPWMDLLGDAVRRGVPVVRATRTGAGPAAGRYSGPGGDIDAEERGLMSAGHRTPAAARIELICVLGAGADPAEAFARPLP
ncbi:MAG: L-asparaginase [Frankiales bacterium]|nr:L-asparaginase [Frankiales bacterium]